MYTYRSDLPRYRVYSQGRIVEDTFDLLGFAWDDWVTFYTGCSFSWESALLQAGLEIRNLTEGRQVSMYQSNIMLCPIGMFSCVMAVTMRPFSENALEKVFEITAQFPDAHGAPIHIGDPSRIGVQLDQLHGGEMVEVTEGEVPVFWACGVTIASAIASAGQTAISQSDADTLCCDRSLFSSLPPSLFLFFSPSLPLSPSSSPMFLLCLVL